MPTKISIVVLTALLALPPTIQATGRGIVVESVHPGGAAERAGLAPGDLLFDWQGTAIGAPAAGAPAGSGPAAGAPAGSGPLDSPFDLAEVEVEQGSRGMVTLHGRRGDEPLEVSLPPGRWGLATIPRLEDRALELYEEARQALAADAIDTAPDRLETLEGEVERAGDAVLALWIGFEIAETLLRVERRDEARTEMEAAISRFDDHLTTDRDRRIAAQARERFAATVVEHGDFATASDAYRHALGLRGNTAHGSDSLGAARILVRLGTIWRGQGHFDEAQTHLRRALEIAHRQAPGSLVVAETLSQLAVVLGMRGDMDGTLDHLRRALAIQEKLSPDGPDLVSTLNRLGLANRRIGDLVAAAGYYRRALEVQEALAPEHPNTAKVLTNLGVLAMKQGDLEVAEDCFRSALDISEKLTPRSLVGAGNLANLGSVFEIRGELETATRYQYRALEIVEQLTPESPDIAIILDSLGNLAFARRELDESERHYRRALALRQREMPDSLDTARSWRDLGAVAIERDALDTAEERLRRAVGIERRIAPGGLDLAHTLGLLAKVAIRRHRPSEAEPLLLEALDIHQRLAPGTLAEATSCHRLASLYRQLGRTGPARQLYVRGMAAVEAQEHRLGGSYLIRSGFGNSSAALYFEAMDFLLEQDELAEAFHVFERSRSRAFLELLGQREMAFGEEIPPELERRRRLVDARYDATLDRLARLDAGSPMATAETLRQALTEARHAQREVKARIRLAAPRVAGLRYPEPLDLVAARHILDPGTLLLAYSLGEERGHVLAIGPGPDEATAHTLALSPDALRREVEQMRSLLRPDASPDALRFRATRLAQLLLADVTDSIERAERLLILPDGPLHALPFSALLVADAEGRSRYLVESKPVTVAASTTVFAQLKEGRSDLGTIRLSAFGDPDYATAPPTADRATPLLRTTLELGRRLDPLPATRDEVESLGALFPDSSQLFLGTEASEEQAKILGGDSDAIHFACHGVIDDRHPLESALVLSLPTSPEKAGENGLLQAWEIFEQIRIDAELVALSACDTALGQELAGEGVLGLARAFQYAGARSVLASLWRVHDQSTAELMEHFYRAWRDGESKGQALRHAQLQLLRTDGPFSHPFYWAAFELIGDWR